MTTSTPITPGTDHQAGTHGERRRRLRSRITDAGLDALLVTELCNVRYLSGFTGSNAALLVGKDEASTVLCTDGRYQLQSAAQVPDLRRVIDRPCDVALLSFADGTLGLEADAVSIAALAHLERAAGDGVRLQPVSGLVQAERAVKDADEIDALARACAIADRALAALIESGGLRPGRTERDVANELDERMRLLGARGPSFDTIVGAGANAAIPHHEPDETVLAAGDLVVIDFGAEVDGYHSDMTRTVVLEAAADWQRELYQLVAQAQAAGRAAAMPGASGGEIDRAARSVIEAAGLGEHFTHGLGHGVGLQIHEAPALASAGAAIMEADMCVTVEPGVYLPERGGVRIEDTGVISPDGYRVLTQTSKDLLVV